MRYKKHGLDARLDASSKGYRDVAKVLRRAADSAANIYSQSTNDRSEHKQTRKNEYPGAR